MVPRIVCLLLVIVGAANGAAPRPNVILIVSDNHAYADLGCFGSNEVISPHLDRLAKEGVKATSFYVTSPACTFEMRW
jgi:arylsulfatase A-like enzyme